MTVITHKESSFRVPTIDITPFRTDPTSIEALKVVVQVREACMTTGFFELVGHGMPRSLQDKLFRAADVLFSLPLEEKKKMDRIMLGGPHNRGYELMGTQVLQQDAAADQKEVYFLTYHFDHHLQNADNFIGLLYLTTLPSRSSQGQDPSRFQWTKHLASFFSHPRKCLQGAT
jgi:isopenicillin N synthase-like dioxygenase